jgi:hypothetical protein
MLEWVGVKLRIGGCAALRVRLWWIGEGDGGPPNAEKDECEIGCSYSEGIDLMDKRFFRVRVLLSRSEVCRFGVTCRPCSPRVIT